jgi:hypothetical protein
MHWELFLSPDTTVPSDTTTVGLEIRIVNDFAIDDE